MKYTLEEIYHLVGREDKTAGVTFRVGSDAYNTYGNFQTLLFIYDQLERHALDKKLEANKYNSSGFVKAKYLGFELEKEKVEKLKTEGIHSDDIASILSFNFPPKNTFHSKEKRTITKLNIKLPPSKKGQDYDWMYGFKKQLIKDNIGLCPEERNFYLAAKRYYEKDQLTDEEKKEVYDQDTKMHDDVEWEFLSIKYQRKEINDVELKRLVQLIKIKEENSFQIIDKYLKKAGSSFSKLVKRNIDQATKIFINVSHYHQRRLNIVGKTPIYADIDSYLHIYLRHVEEMKVEKTYEDKDNFQWAEEDVFMVMGKIIEEINDEIQEHFLNKPGKRYSRYGKTSIYFEGDYYTFHIEPNGRISTFHKNRKTG